MQSLTVASLTLTPFSYPLKHPFIVAGVVISQRTGFHVTLNFSDGSSTQGEIAPLPGVSSETLQKAQYDTQVAAAVLKNWPMPAYGLGDLLEKLKAETRLTALCSSVRFGIESALLDRGGFLKDVPLKVESAGLLQGNYEQVMAQAQVLKAQGVRTFKLKVGDRNIPLDVKKAKDVRTFMGQGLLRLDANRAWGFDEAVLFGQLVTPERIEFIEEPLKDMARLGEFYHATRMPTALDETLLTARCGVEAPGRCSPTLAKQEGVKAYVIKPMVIGGVLAAMDWIAEATRNGKQAIISSSFESPVGMRMLKALAKRSGQTAGLGTEAWFGD